MVVLVGAPKERPLFWIVRAADERVMQLPNVAREPKRLELSTHASEQFNGAPGSLLLVLGSTELEI